MLSQRHAERDSIHGLGQILSYAQASGTVSYTYSEMNVGGNYASATEFQLTPTGTPSGTDYTPTLTQNGDMTTIGVGPERGTGDIAA